MRKSPYAVIDRKRANFEDQRYYDILEATLLILDSKLYFDKHDNLRIDSKGRSFLIEKL